MKGQTHDLTEIHRAIKAVQAEIAEHPLYDDTCNARLWREVATRSVGCMERMVGMLQEQTAQNRTLAQEKAHMEDPYASPKR